VWKDASIIVIATTKSSVREGGGSKKWKQIQFW